MELKKTIQNPILLHTDCIPTLRAGLACLTGRSSSVASELLAIITSKHIRTARSSKKQIIIQWGGPETAGSMVLDNDLITPAVQVNIETMYTPAFELGVDSPFFIATSCLNKTTLVV